VQDPHRWNFEWACDWGSALGTFWVLNLQGHHHARPPLPCDRLSSPGPVKARPQAMLWCSRYTEASGRWFEDRFFLKLFRVSAACCILGLVSASAPAFLRAQAVLHVLLT
jgi:hypothetical protein